ncbi:MAG: hypothetical protein RSA29_10330 [Clostridium sp.]
MKTYSVTIMNGKKKIVITNVVNGNDKRKEAADIVCCNKRVTA